MASLVEVAVKRYCEENLSKIVRDQFTNFWPDQGIIKTCVLHVDSNGHLLLPSQHDKMYNGRNLGYDGR